MVCSISKNGMKIAVWVGQGVKINSYVVFGLLVERVLVTIPENA